MVDAALDAYLEQGLSFNKSEVAQNICTFIKGRMEQIARDAKIKSDTVAAVSRGTIEAPVDFFALAHALDDARANDAETFDNLATAYARASHLADSSLGQDVDEAPLLPVEHDLLRAIDAAQDKVHAAIDSSSYAEVISSLAELREPIDRFFDEVLVMDEDETIKNNRLRLLNRFVSVFHDVADMGELARK